MHHSKSKKFLKNIHSNIEKNITGLVLAGGKSSRMGMDKALLNYNGIPQQFHLYYMFQKICSKVYISCNNNQISEIDKSYNAIVDNENFAEAGPMTGLLSFANSISAQAVLLAGCDYPYLKIKDLKFLLENRSSEFEAVCYFNEKTGFDEPLIAVYETSSLKKLFEYYKTGNNSLRMFLSTINTKRLKPLSAKAIESVDTLEKAIEISKNITKTND